MMSQRAAASWRVMRERICWTKPTSNSATVTSRKVIMMALAIISTAKKETSRLNFARRLNVEQCEKPLSFVFEPTSSVLRIDNDRKKRNEEHQAHALHDRAEED